MAEVINSFPGYEFVRSKDGSLHNMYRGVDLGFGGWVFSKAGIYRNVALIDAASLHPTSIILLNKLGRHTSTYADLKEARVLIKHKKYDEAKKLFSGKLAKYLTNDEDADDLSSALKIPLNSFYGISSASYENPARDSRDKNNIIALRGALFMKTLFDAVVENGYEVIHIKTDSIKVANADDYIVKFVQEFGTKYGYEMEHEATYDRICLIDKAQYIARYDSYGIRNKGGKHANEWTATGAEFQHPYIFKTLFSKEPISFSDLCETKTVTSALYLDMNEGLEEGEHDYRFVGKAGLFTPIKPGCGGGVLLREKDGKYYAATGSKGYRWLESEAVQALGKESDVDIGYFRKLVDDAVDHIREFGDFDDFVNGHGESGGDYVVPCGDGKYNSCFDCPNLDGIVCKLGWNLDGHVERR